MTKEKFKTYSGVFDEFTIKTIDTLYKRKYFDERLNILKVGKEADVYLLKHKNFFRVIKIYRINTSNFNKINEYIKFDFRFKNLKGNKRKIILEWTKKEFRNLKKCEKIINSPTPIKFLNNCIIMEYLEGDILKNSILENPQNTFLEIINQIKILKDKVKLVHGDLSEFNIIVKDNKPHLIDFGQAFSFKNEYDFNKIKFYFIRDIKNIVNFFNKKFKLEIDLDKVLQEFKL